MTPGFPVASTVFGAELRSRPTNYMLTIYSDQVLIAVSQTGTLGTMLQARCGVPCSTVLLLQNCPLLRASFSRSVLIARGIGTPGQTQVSKASRSLVFPTFLESEMTPALCSAPGSCRKHCTTEASTGTAVLAHSLAQPMLRSDI
jgi:hypothetical protein